jgi:Tfp pilus assembly protein PilV
MGAQHGRRGERGFTLLEVLMTLGVTTIGLIGLMALHFSVAQGNDAASRSADAAQVANSTLDSLRAMRRQAMVQQLTGNPFVLPPIDVTPPDQIVRGMTFHRRVVVTVPSADLWLVRVEVFWWEDGAPEVPLNGFDHRIAVETLRPFVGEL